MKKEIIKTIYDLYQEYLKSCEGYYSRPEVEPTFNGFMRFVSDQVPFEGFEDKEAL